MKLTLPKLIKQYYLLPLEYCKESGEILDAREMQVAQIMNYGIGEREYLTKALDGTSKKLDDFHFSVDNRIISIENKVTGYPFEFLQMRGWGKLVNESYFNLSPQDATRVQNEMASYLARLLNKGDCSKSSKA